MATRDLQCPTCDCDLALAGDEASGEEVFCGVCGAPCVLRGKVSEDDCEVDADF